MSWLVPLIECVFTNFNYPGSFLDFSWLAIFRSVINYLKLQLYCKQVMKPITINLKVNLKSSQLMKNHSIKELLIFPFNF